MKTIGLVLSSVPGYSETFFTSKISGLSKNGFRIILFAGGKKNPGLAANLVRPFPVLQERWAMLVFTPLVLGWTFLRAPGNFLRLWRLETAASSSRREIIERIYTSAHLLPFQLDWLHFGFITQAVKKENVASAMRARMGVSLRGFDICIYPLTHPHALDKIWKRIDKLHVISDDLLQVAYRFGFPLNNLAVKITPAIDVAAFVKVSQQSNWDPHHLQLLTVGRLHWKKGLEYSFEACRILKEKGIRFHYTLVGDGAEKEKLIFLADQLGITENVVFAGKVSHQEVIKLMHSANIYLQPSIQEGFCNSVLEAQAAGMLCVVSDAEGLKENVLDGQTGWVTPKRQAGPIAKAIEEIISYGEEKREAIRQYAIERVTRDFSIVKQIAAWVEFYDG